MSWESYIPKDIMSLYEVHDFKHAAAVIANEFQEAFGEICEALRKFRFTIADIRTAGGNESQIPKKYSRILRPMGWVESQLNAKLFVDEREIRHDTHKVDYLKGRVAFDLEWNSKDQTFDRDLYAFKSFFEYDKISVAVLVTRGKKMNTLFNNLGEYVDKNGIKRLYKAKYGASTTHIGKLLPRLEAGRNGGCPVLVFGITPQLLINNNQCN